MGSSIPASAIVSVIPGVLGAGGDALDLIGLVLTNSTRVPIGTVESFSTSSDVAGFFGPSSHEANIASVYFLGYDNSFAKPGAILYAQYPTAAVPAYLRGGNISALTLTQLQALTGVLTIMVDGVSHTSSSISLAGATSFSNAASIIQTDLAGNDTTFTASIATTVLTVSAVATGTIAIGQAVTGVGVSAGTVIISEGTGTGGTGTYNLNISQSVSSVAMAGGPVGVSYDSVSGAFVISSGETGAGSSIAFASGSIAAALLVTQATGAILSQGAAIATPNAFMTALANTTQNWASFMTGFAPSTGDQVAFAAWNNAQDNRFLYALWDTDITLTESNDSSSSVAQIIAAGYSGTAPIYEPTDLYQAAFLMGYVASLDFTRTNGRATAAFRSQSGITPGVTDATTAAQLIANGCNFYGAYATANQNFQFFYPGSVTGEFLWIDSYINQIQLNSQLQLAMMTLLTSAGSIPYNDAGYALIEAGCADPINAALNFGTIRANVPLSILQAAEVNAAAGKPIDTILSTRGWYLQVLPATAQVRAARGSPPITLWFMDGQSVQKINLASIEVQ